MRVIILQLNEWILSRPIYDPTRYTRFSNNPFPTDTVVKQKKSRYKNMLALNFNLVWDRWCQKLAIIETHLPGREWDLNRSHAIMVDLVYRDCFINILTPNQSVCKITTQFQIYIISTFES